MVDFSENSGYINPSELKTGDLLFPWNHLDVPVLLSKPTPPPFELTHALTLKSLTDGTINLVPILDRLFEQLKTSINNKDNHVLKHYSGHVVMIIRENDICYVVEAGATDYCNYRVTISPYYIEAESVEGFDINRMRGWLNRRFFNHEKTWLARLPNDISQPNQLKLVEYAKSLVGRPYGMLDTVKFADDSRIYCSDFIYKCYEHISIELDDQRTWTWLLTSPTLRQLGIDINLPIDPIILGLIETLIGNSMGLTQPPALCLPALYYSKHLKHVNTVIHSGTTIIYGVE